MFSAEQPRITAACQDQWMLERVLRAVPGMLLQEEGRESSQGLNPQFACVKILQKAGGSPLPSPLPALVWGCYPGCFPRCGSERGVTSWAAAGTCRSCTSPGLPLPAAASRAGLDSPGACGCQPGGSHVEEQAGQLFSAWGSLPASLHPSLPKALHDSEAGAAS